MHKPLCSSHDHSEGEDVGSLGGALTPHHLGAQPPLHDSHGGSARAKQARRLGLRSRAHAGLGRITSRAGLKKRDQPFPTDVPPRTSFPLLPHRVHGLQGHRRGRELTASASFWTGPAARCVARSLHLTCNVIGMHEFLTAMLLLRVLRLSSTNLDRLKSVTWGPRGHGSTSIDLRHPENVVHQWERPLCSSPGAARRLRAQVGGGCRPNGR